MDQQNVINLQDQESVPEWVTEIRQVFRQDMEHFQREISQLRIEMDKCLDNVKKANGLIKSSNELSAIALKKFDSINAQMDINNAEMEACTAEMEVCSDGLAACRATIEAEKVKKKNRLKEIDEIKKKIKENELQTAEIDQYWKDRIEKEIEKRSRNRRGRRIPQSSNRCASAGFFEVGNQLNKYNLTRRKHCPSAPPPPA